MPAPKDPIKKQEWIRKLSEKSKGNKSYKFRIKNGHIKGTYKHSKKTKEKLKRLWTIERKIKASYEKQKQKNPMWKHGRYAIRRIIFEEIGKKYICELCGSTQQIEIHHKDKNQYNNKIENIAILCKSCHSKQHRQKKFMDYVRSFKL